MKNKSNSFRPAMVPTSGLAGVIWPAIPNQPEALVLAIQHQYDQSQWWSPSDILKQQLSQAENLLAHAARTVPWYREKFRDLPPLRRGELTAETFCRLPILMRTDIQEASEQLHSAAAPQAHGKTSVIRTSGSTGRPIAVKTTRLKGLLFQAGNLRYHLWHRRDMGAKVAAIRILSAEQRALGDDLPPMTWAPAYRSGPMVMFDVTRPVAEQAAWLVEQNPDYLLTNPSTLKSLLEHAPKVRQQLNRLHHVVTMGEVLDVDVRKLCRSTWNVAVVDSYSAQEIGFLALQCPECEHYHLHAEGALTEILDEAGNPCLPGQTGRVVVTDLHNFAMPLIRYEIGDYAVVGEPCSCGRGLPVLTRILGRSRNMLTLASGARVWPRLSSKTLADMPLIRQVQFVQNEIGAIDVRMAVARPLAETEEAELANLLVKNLGHPFDIRFAYVEAIERSANGKFEDFISNVSAAPNAVDG